MTFYERLPWKKPELEPMGAPPGVFKPRKLALDFPAAVPVKERALLLLRAASEVEHQFIIQYLYALYCGGGAYAGDLVTIAKEEMGHLITVQNLLAVLGAPPYLGRIDGAQGVEQPFAFSLEPFQISFVARFLVAESAQAATLPADIEDRLPPDLNLDEINRVGALYQAIYWLFQDPAAAAGPWHAPLGADLSEFQNLGHLQDSDFADPAAVAGILSVAVDWSGTQELTSPVENVLVMPAADWGTDKSKMRAAALKAIHAVAAQGEGPVTLPADSEPSHAERLRAIYDALAAGPAPSPSLYPTNPFVKEGSTDDNALSGEAATAAAALDKAYERLLLRIALAIVTMPDGSQHASDAIYDSMFGIRGAAQNLVTKPRRAGSELLAGPPFTFPAQGIPTVKAEIEERLGAL